MLKQGVHLNIFNLGKNPMTFQKEKKKEKEKRIGVNAWLFDVLQ